MVVAKSDFLADLVQAVAACREEMPTPREFIEEALERIEQGKEPDVPRYPNGMPTMKGVSDIAVRLEAASKSKQ
jgi:hypothetical protein